LRVFNQTVNFSPKNGKDSYYEYKKTKLVPTSASFKLNPQNSVFRQPCIGGFMHEAQQTANIKTAKKMRFSLSPAQNL
jgi:hypothetical protein